MSQSTELAGLVIPKSFIDYVLEQSVNKNGLVKSGIITLDPTISATLAKGGDIATIMTFKTLDSSATAANASSSDQATKAVPELITARKQLFPRVGRNKSFSSADWNVSMLGTDPAAYIGGQFVDVVAKWRQASLLKYLIGQTGASGATNVSNISAAAIASYNSSTQINAATVTDFCVNTWGDFSSADMFSAAIVMHSKTYAFLSKNDYTAFTRPSTQTLGFTLYLGMPVIVDDTLPVAAGGTDGHVYTTYFVRAGGIRFGVGSPKTPVAVSRDELAGNGAGADIVSLRDEFAYHTVGMSYTGTVAGDSVTDTELGTTGNWTQILSGKQVGVGVLKHNLAA